MKVQSLCNWRREVGATLQRGRWGDGGCKQVDARGSSWPEYYRQLSLRVQMVEGYHVLSLQDEFY
jgi:hypothetical protein